MIRKLRIFLILLAICAMWVGVLRFGAWTTSAQADPSPVAKGQKVYEAKRCAICHRIAGKGGKIGADLTNVGAKRDAGWLRKFTKDPKSIDPSAKMPAFRGTDEELDAVVAYMASLK